MNRIQNILDKAEREGTVRRIRATESAAVAVEPIPPVAPPPSPALIDALSAPSPIPAAPPVRIMTGARLDRRLLAATGPDSIAAEQYRALRTRMLHADNGSAVQIVMITSPGRGDGKSLTAANLALTMAQEYQRRICLVDAD